jgi:diguanylate cyclase (GGDEF)-like protein
VSVQPTTIAAVAETAGPPVDQGAARPVRPRPDPLRLAVGGVDEPAAVRQLGLFIHWLIPAAWFFTALLIGVYLVYPQAPILLNSLLIAMFAGWLTITWRRLRPSELVPFARRLALGVLLMIAGTGILQPAFVAVLSLATVLPVIVAMPYLDSASLRRLIVVAWGTCLTIAVIGEVLPDQIALPPALHVGLRLLSMAVVFGLCLVLLWQHSSRVTASAHELRSVVALSSELAQTMNPLTIGDLMAEHIARATGADESGICYWDRVGDRVLTYGYYPLSRRAAVDESYDLADYPATQRVLHEQDELLVADGDPGADQAEIEYLRSIGMRTMAMLPLVARGEAIGAVEVYWSDARRILAHDLGLARALAHEAAIALDNARLYEEIRHQAFHDGLSGLANRALFTDRVEHALARSVRSGSTLAVLFLDLDDFKTVNDRFGHPAGDQLLRVAAQRLTGVLRSGDTAARLGGDEFAVLLEDLATPDDARIVADRLIESIRTPIRLGEIDALVGASVGVALSTAGTETADDLLRNADFAMYRAKGAGKGRSEVFQPTMRAGIAERAELERLIDRAVEQDELRLVYQPIIELASGTIVGVEALIRWQPAGRSLVMPADFIPLAEETGQIVPIGRWVVEEACRQARVWQERLGRPEFGVSVNLSARQFQHPGLVAEVLNAVDRAGIPPSSLTLEITESVLMQHTTSTLATLGQLRASGVRLAIDDFGTGYSSLSYLDRFPVDALKIDRSFIDGFGAGREGPVLVRAIIELGQALDLEIVAEGIERADQLGPLRDLGCRFGQGYLFARPLEAMGLDGLLAAAIAQRDERVVALPVQGQRPVALPGPRRRTPPKQSARPIARSRRNVG